MLRQDVIEFLNKEYNCKKGDMKTIKALFEQAKGAGYELVKNGPDNYELVENGVIVDFSKPLMIRRELPHLAASQAYNGVPVSLLLDWDAQNKGFNPELWCYLMNKNDGDQIRFDEIVNLHINNCDSYEKIVRAFDSMCFMGYMKDKRDCIECYAYPIIDHPEGPYMYMMGYLKRKAPVTLVK